MRFIYQARDAAGNVKKDILDAKTAVEANEVLSQQGLTVMSIQAEGGPGGKGLKKIRSDDAIYFANQLAVMVDTGVPLSEALHTISESTDHSGLQVMVADLSEQVQSGVEFSSALGKYKHVFGELFVSLVRASEASGTMGSMLQRAADYMSHSRDTRRQVKGAMIYPVCMLAFCVLVVVGLLIFILPRFESIYAGKDAILPVPTRALMGFSRFFVGNWIYIVVALAGLVGGAIAFLRNENGRRVFDQVLLQIPVLGPMYRKACLARSLRTMSTMVTTGVGMLEGLDITAHVAGNYVYRTLWMGLADCVREGGTVSEALFRSRDIPRTIAQMVDAGERTGQLGPVMDRVATYCEDEMKVAIKSMTSLIEPVLVIFMGIIIGGIAMALLLPIFKMSSMVNN